MGMAEMVGDGGAGDCSVNIAVAVPVARPVLNADGSVRKPRARKRPKDALTHVVSVCLRPTPGQQSQIETRLDSGRKVYNACLAEFLARSRRVRADPEFEAAKKMPTGRQGTKVSADRSRAFAAVDERHGFTASAAMSFGSSLRQSWVRQHVLAQEAQTMAGRAFTAVHDWHVGVRGRPRFKSWRQGLRSMECKDNNGALHPKIVDGHVVGVLWGRGFLLELAPTDHTDTAERIRLDAWAAAGKVRSTRIVHTLIAGRDTYRAQMVIDGPAPIRHPVGTGSVSIDLGPSQVAVVVADNTGAPVSGQIHRLADGIEAQTKLLRRWQRKLDRQHRAGSPDCFDAKGKHRRGRCGWKDRSKAAQRTTMRIADAHRRIAAHRRSSHGHLVNELLAHGSEVRAEKLNYVSWQKNFPRSVRDRAPGLFMQELGRKAENAGGPYLAYSPWSTALSQTCVCGARVKKPLSVRLHRCPCGVAAGRDLFSAYLGLFVDRLVDEQSGASGDVLDLSAAAEDFPLFRGLLQESGGSPGSSTRGVKHRGRGRASVRSTARVSKRHHQRGGVRRGPTEMLGEQLSTLTMPAAAPTLLAA